MSMMVSCQLQRCAVKGQANNFGMEHLKRRLEESNAALVHMISLFIDSILSHACK